MKNYKTIIFDLDGTLINSKPGIVKSFQYSLSRFNIVEKDLAKIENFIGPPLKESFQNHYKLDDKLSDKAVEYYREYYREKGIFDHQLYSGIEELLKKLKQDNKRLFIATSKLEIFAKQIIDFFSLNSYFEIIVGENPAKNIFQKTDAIKFVLDKNKDISTTDVIMVGDREYDIVGAKNNNIDSIGVLYGYGSRQELQAAGADYLVKSVNELIDL